MCDIFEWPYISPRVVRKKLVSIINLTFRVDQSLQEVSNYTLFIKYFMLITLVLFLNHCSCLVIRHLSV